MLCVYEIQLLYIRIKVVVLCALLHLGNMFVKRVYAFVIELEHHCGPGLVSGSAEAYSDQRRTDPEC